MTEILRRYRAIGRDEGYILSSLRHFLSNTQRMYREFELRQNSGGRDGDLGNEIMEYDLYVIGTAGGMTRGGVWVYSVVDDGANGYAQLISVLVGIPSDPQAEQAVLRFLDSDGFVSNYASFRDRPAGWKCYRSYLDAPPEIPWTAGFKHDQEGPKKAA